MASSQQTSGTSRTALTDPDVSDRDGDSIEYPITVALVAQQLDPAGVERNLIPLVRGLPRAEFEPHVIVRSAEEHAFETLQGLGVSRERMCAGTPPHPGSFFDMIEQLESRDPDIVHSFGSSNDLFGRIAASIVSIPVVINTRSRQDDPGLVDRFLRQFQLGLVDCEISVSVSAEEPRGTTAHGGWEKRVALPEGVSSDPVRMSEPEKREFRLRHKVPEHATLVISRLNRASTSGHKLLEALPRLRSVHPDLHLVLFGDRAEGDELLDQIETLELQDHVTLSGWTNQFRAWCTAADLYVDASERGASPGLLLEALAQDLSFVVTRSTEAQEVLRTTEEPGGIVVEPGSSRGLASAIEEVLDQRKGFQRRARDHGEVIRRNFSFSKMISQHRSLYHQLLSETQS